MRHRRNYQHVSVKGCISTVGFLGTPYPFGLSPKNVGVFFLCCIAYGMMLFSMY
jgi:hypothetical protein